MFDTFNMGVGLVIVVNSDSSKFILNRFKQVKKIGEIKEYQVGFLHNFKDSESNKKKFEEIKTSYTDDDLRARCLDLSEKVAH